MVTRGVILAIAWGLTLPGWAATPPPAYQQVAAQAGIPPAVLFAVALQESGTRLRGQHLPWPWTLNIGGSGQRFASRAQACAALHQALRDHSPTRIDVGLGQTNLGYHLQRYANACEALDPRANLVVTAALLRAHYRVVGDWVAAAGRYHRPAGGAPAARYRAQFVRQLQRVSASPPTAVE